MCLGQASCENETAPSRPTARSTLPDYVALQTALDSRDKSTLLVGVRVFDHS